MNEYANQNVLNLLHFIDEMCYNPWLWELKWKYGAKPMIKTCGLAFF